MDWLPWPFSIPLPTLAPTFPLPFRRVWFGVFGLALEQKHPIDNILNTEVREEERGGWEAMGNGEEGRTVGFQHRHRSRGAFGKAVLVEAFLGFCEVVKTFCARN